MAKKDPYADGKWPSKAKKEPAPYKPKVRKPVPEPTPAPEHYCMWGCGYSAGSMGAVRSHEAGCDRKT